MSPTWARKGSKRWRYYVSQAALQGDKSKAGSIVRVPAAEVEALVTDAVGRLSADRPASRTDIRDKIDRVAIDGMAIQVRLSEVGEAAVQKLLDDVRARKIDAIVVYKVDRLTRSLADFAKLVASCSTRPRGFCIERLTDLPMLWSEQWGAIGLQAPAQVRAELS